MAKLYFISKKRAVLGVYRWSVLGRNFINITFLFLFCARPAGTFGEDKDENLFTYHINFVFLVKVQQRSVLSYK